MTLEQIQKNHAAALARWLTLNRTATEITRGLRRGSVAQLIRVEEQMDEAAIHLASLTLQLEEAAKNANR